MGRLADLATRLLTKAATGLIDYCIERYKRRLTEEEKALTIKLAKLLSFPKEKISVRLYPYGDGSVLPSIELRWGVSQAQLAQAKDFLDGLSPIRQNVRTPSPMVN